MVCRARDGREVARITLAPIGDAPVVQLAPHAARQPDVPALQLRESSRYEYELDRPGLRLRCALARASALAGRRERGVIETGTQCGLLRLEIVDARGEALGAGMVDVRSVKLGDHEHYRAMLNDLGARMIGLLYDARSSSQLALAPAWRDEPQALQQQIEFLRETLASPAFQNAQQRILAAPHQRLAARDERRPISQPARRSRDLMRQFLSAPDRVTLPHNHPLAARMRTSGNAQPSAPANIVIARHAGDLDTPENQFVKHALSSFRDFLGRAARALEVLGGSWSIVADRARHAERALGRYLGHALFQDVSPARSLPLSSPVLQRQPAYREVLQAWLRFEANARIQWTASDDIFHAGKRDTAQLYEYWLFFHLLDWFCARFTGARPATRALLREDRGRVMLALRHGVMSGPFEGTFAASPRPLRAQLAYNQTFAASVERARAGSWTRAMRPDYTLTFWPAEYTLAEAEADELAVHLHLDAKYRVEEGRDPLETGDDEASDAARADLLKMHAYRDAIRRSEGAYVLYPGKPDAFGDPLIMRGFGEILPSLGAFAILPGPLGQAEGFARLSAFLDDVLEHLSNQATQREQRAYHTYAASRLPARPPAIPRALRERDDAGARAIPPFEQLILVAWHEPGEIALMRERGHVVVRLGKQAHALALLRELSAATHILLRSHDGRVQPGLWRISASGGRLLTRAELAREGHVVAHGNADLFAAFDAAPDPVYTGWQWDGPALRKAIAAFERRTRPKYANAKRSGEAPRMLSLGDALTAAR